MIRALRSNPLSLSSILDEIRIEIAKPELTAKANAIAKLTHLHMMGHDMAWASFHIIQTMAGNASQKRIGYLAAAACFHPQVDTLMLCTNLIRKDLASNDYLDGALAMHCLAQIVTPELARDLHMDLIASLNHSKPYMRKRAVLTLYRVILKYPEALLIGFPRLKEKLDDPDPGVVCAVVNVICELSRKNPKSYLPLAPQLYLILQSSSNNWMLIKIVKLFASLSVLEPRLVKKLLPPLTSLLQSTKAMSVMYECISTLITGGMIQPDSVSQESDQVASLCLSKLKQLISDNDQNLKFLGLLALGKLLPLRPSAVGEMGDTVLECLRDPDISIRNRALELISAMATSTNLFSIVKRLVLHLTYCQNSKESELFDTEYRVDIVKAILQICSRDGYAHVPDFEWYLTMLLDLLRPGLGVGSLLSHEWIQVTIRVKEVEAFSVETLVNILKQKCEELEFLEAPIWICGEFSHLLQDPLKLADLLMELHVSPHLQPVLLLSLFKIHRLTPLPHLMDYLSRFTTSPDLYLQNRACIFSSLSPKGALALFQDEISPISTKAQKRVPLPPGLDLDQTIIETVQEPVQFLEEQAMVIEEDPLLIEQRKKDRLERLKNDPFYLSTPTKMEISSNVDSIPIETLDLQARPIAHPHPRRSPERKSYAIKKEEDVEGVFENEDELEALKVSDPDKYAVMSVDLTVLERDGYSPMPSDQLQSLPVKTKKKKKTKKTRRDSQE